MFRDHCCGVDATVILTAESVAGVAVASSRMVICFASMGVPEILDLSLDIVSLCISVHQFFPFLKNRLFQVVEKMFAQVQRVVVAVFV